MLDVSKLIIATATATTKGTPSTIRLCLARTIRRSSKLTSSSSVADEASLVFSTSARSDMMDDNSRSRRNGHELTEQQLLSAPRMPGQLLDTLLSVIA